jgi:hypothetical protein
MSINKPASRGLPVAVFAVLSMLLAAGLFVPAAALTFSRKAVDEFNATGLPSWIRLALAVPEMAGAVLFALPRTFYLGTVVLLLVLAGAIAAHLSLGIRPTGLYALMAAVSLLALMRRYFLPCKIPQ